MTGYSIIRAFTAASLLLAVAVSAATKDLGNGYRDHGVATPVSNHRGIVATVDGQGRNVALVWLFDRRGGYALLMIDAETGKSQEFAMPFPPGGDCPYSSILSSGNKYYTHFNSHFCEFDPVKRAFTFEHATVPQMAMGMTEDDQGAIWLVSYPQSGVASFNPKTREFKDYGHVHKENWQQYQRSVVADDAGWIYFGMGNTNSHVFAVDPTSGKTTPMVPETDRKPAASGQVFRDLNGKVYGTAGGDWYELHKGQARKLDAKPEIKTKPVITSSQSLFHQQFPDGKVLRECDTIERVIVVEDPKTGKTFRNTFEYQSEGAHVMACAAAPDGTICGGTAFPMRFFSYDPRKDTWVNREAFGQWNTVTVLGDRFFVGTYTHGGLLEWDPAKPWVPTEPGKADSNPRLLAKAENIINRPHDVFAHPDGSLLVLAGTPGYGMTGGGLLFWDRKAGRQEALLQHTEILPEQSTMCMVTLPDGKLLGGSTVDPGTGGERKATLAELYIMDIATRKVEWHAPVLPNTQSYAELCLGPKGLVYGIADYTRFFVFDPATRKVVHEQELSAELGRTCGGQGPRLIVRDPKGPTYILLRKGVARLDPRDYKLTLLAESPVPVNVGGDYLDGRIYFASGSHICSYTLSPTSRPN